MYFCAQKDMEFKIDQSWGKFFKTESKKEYFKKLENFVKEEYKTQTIYPSQSKIFEAYNLCKLDNLKAVIIGQDPYHGAGQAHGLCFSVNNGVKFPPSLRNIFKELKNDINCEIPLSGNLENWAKQGVLMINAIHTVRESQAGSHQKKGWETFTDSLIKFINDEKEHVVFILWGAFAQQKAEFIDQTKHHILESVHPSPLSASRGYFGNNHFSKTNAYLKENGKKEIDWILSDGQLLFK
jgi:uracil-DNA glycosylase